MSLRDLARMPVKWRSWQPRRNAYGDAQLRGCFAAQAFHSLARNDKI